MKAIWLCTSLPPYAQKLNNLCSAQVICMFDESKHPSGQQSSSWALSGLYIVSLSSIKISQFESYLLQIMYLLR